MHTLHTYTYTNVTCTHYIHTLIQTLHAHITYIHLYKRYMHTLHTYTYTNVTCTQYIHTLIQTLHAHLTYILLYKRYIHTLHIYHIFLMTSAHSCTNSAWYIRRYWLCYKVHLCVDNASFYNSNPCFILGLTRVRYFQT